MCICGGMACWYIAKDQLGEAWALPLAKRSWPLRLLGAGLMAASVQLRMSSIERFQHHRTPLTHKQQSRVLVTDGPFQWSRNPMYLSMLGNIGSVGLMANTWWCLVATLPFAAYLNFWIIPGEEEYLRAKFDSYEEYAQRTRRWL
ncbi:unnamed protein product [Effrenium voratum]|nr:unnamed protein product [Effrenium voratum]